MWLLCVEGGEELIVCVIWVGECVSWMVVVMCRKRIMEVGIWKQGFLTLCMSSMCPCGVKGWGIWAEWVDLNVCVVRVRCVALWGWELGKY